MNSILESIPGGAHDVICVNGLRLFICCCGKNDNQEFLHYCEPQLSLTPVPVLSIHGKLRKPYAFTVCVGGL